MTPGEWEGAAESLLDEAVDRKETISCDFEELAVRVPLRTGRDAPTAEWGLDGTVEITIQGDRGPLADWMEWWNERG